mmetsp:Transcript_31196/g.41445  ORF Transcript_31196/g.41445 Transcript_31196/m.41445 type:complete len:82 (-) Transcript_31196:690-935(-)
MLRDDMNLHQLIMTHMHTEIWLFMSRVKNIHFFISTWSIIRFQTPFPLPSPLPSRPQVYLPLQWQHLQCLEANHMPPIGQS